MCRAFIIVLPSLPLTSFRFCRNDYARFTYLTMFIKESLRLYPPVLIIGRELENDMTVKSNLHQRYETVVPRSCRALVNIFTLHRNENMWEDPEVSAVTVTLSCHVSHVLPSLSEVHVFDMARYYRGIVVLLFYNI